MQKRQILCNECYKPLSKQELKEYPIQWQFSGDMYCTKHKPKNCTKHKPKKRSPHCLSIKSRIEYLRQEIRKERISYDEIVELQNLIDYIDKNDTELLEWVKNNQE